MLKSLSIIATLSLLLGACAAPPRQELQVARKAVAEAYASGAKQLAADEYELASAALHEGEELVRRKKYEEAGRTLPLATGHARRAMDKSQAEKARIDAARRLQEERARAAAEAAAAEPPKPPEPPPAPSKPKPVPTTPPPPTHYTVVNGETLWTIAARKEIYLDALLWPLLYKANRDQIKDPRQIYPGQVLNIPREVSAEEREEARETARQSDIFPVDQLTVTPPDPTR